MIIPEIKRRLDEIKALYSLEPSLRDLYVEGPTEVNIFRWFFEKNDRKDVHIYPIDVIEVPDSLLESANLTAHSNRNRVMLLAEELSKEFNKGKINVRCIADADYDRHLSRCRTNYILEYTDYTSTEMYFFNEKFISKFLNLVLHGFPLSPTTLLIDMSRVLQRIFLMHLANDKLNWNMTWVDFRQYILWNQRKIKFDEERFLKSYLMRNGRVKNLKEFKSVIGYFEDKLHSDVRHNIRGHDFTYLFFLISKRYKGHRTGFRDHETFEGSLCGCLELDFVKDENLFIKLSTI